MNFLTLIKNIDYEPYIHTFPRWEIGSTEGCCVRHSGYFEAQDRMARIFIIYWVENWSVIMPKLIYEGKDFLWWNSWRCLNLYPLYIIRSSWKYGHSWEEIIYFAGIHEKNVRLKHSIQLLVMSKKFPFFMQLLHMTASSPKKISVCYPYCTICSYNIT